MEEPFAWQDMLEEHRDSIRKILKYSLAASMLALTCRAERAAYGKDDQFDQPYFWFSDACREGSLAICKWLYNDVKRTVYFEKDDGEEKEEEEEEEDFMGPPYEFDDALFYGQFHIADWAHSVGISLRDNADSHLALNDKLAALKWLVAHGYKLGPYILSSASSRSLELIKWLVDDQGFTPEYRHIYAVLPSIPGTLPIVEYYFHCGVKVEADSLHRAAYSGRWDILGVIKKHQRDLYDAFILEVPRIKELMETRPKVGWRQYMDITRGVVVTEDPDSD